MNSEWDAWVPAGKTRRRVRPGRSAHRWRRRTRSRSRSCSTLMRARPLTAVGNTAPGSNATGENTECWTPLRSSRRWGAFRLASPSPATIGADGKPAGLTVSSFASVFARATTRPVLPVEKGPSVTMHSGPRNISPSASCRRARIARATVLDPRCAQVPGRRVHRGRAWIAAGTVGSRVPRLPQVR